MYSPSLKQSCCIGDWCQNRRPWVLVQSRGLCAASELPRANGPCCHGATDLSRHAQGADQTVRQRTRAPNTAQLVGCSEQIRLFVPPGGRASLVSLYVWSLNIEVLSFWLCQKSAVYMIWYVEVNICTWQD